MVAAVLSGGKENQTRHRRLHGRPHARPEAPDSVRALDARLPDARFGVSAEKRGLSTTRSCLVATMARAPRRALSDARTASPAPTDTHSSSGKARKDALARRMHRTSAGEEGGADVLPPRPARDPSESAAGARECGGVVRTARRWRPRGGIGTVGLQRAGSASASQLAAEHRELLGYLLGRIGHPGRPELPLARELRQFAALLREDTREEEDTLLILDAPAERPAGVADVLIK